MVTSSSKIITSGYNLTVTRAQEIGAERRGKDPRRSRLDQLEVANQSLAFELAIRAQKTCAPSMRVEETEHFLIFQAMDGHSDRPLGELAERMHVTVTQLVGVEAGQDVWIGKCPIYSFWDDQQYLRFSRDVGAGFKGDTPDGWHGKIADVRFICLARCEGRTRFFEVFVRQGAQSFLETYVNRRPSAWLREGVAGLAVARAVPAAGIEKTYLAAARSATDLSIAAPGPGNKPPDPAVNAPPPPGPAGQPKPTDLVALMTQDTLDENESLLAYGLVRYLAAIDAKSFKRMLALIKQGKSEPDALLASFGLTPPQLAREWTEAALRETGRR